MAPPPKPTLEDRVDVVETKVDQLRAVFKLNGNLSPEAAAEAASTWEELRLMAQRNRQSMQALGMTDSPEVFNEAVQTWKDMVEMVKRDRAVKEMRESYREVRADIARRMSWVQHPWSLLKWLLPALGGAMAWRVANAMHVSIHTPWGSLVL